MLLDNIACLFTFLFTSKHFSLLLQSTMDNDDGCVCTICDQKEADGSKVLTCMYCFSCVHFKCKNIVGKAICRMRESDYFCSSDCSAIYLRIISMQNSNKSMFSSFAAEMKATIAHVVANEIKSVTTEVRQITATIEKSQEFLSAKFDEIVSDLNDIKLENERLKDELNCLKKSHSQLQGTVHKLEASVDKSDKAALSSNAVVWGIPTAPKENVNELVQKVLCCLGLGGNSELVLSAERMFANHKTANTPVPIRIVFCSKESKEEVLNKKKLFGKLLSTAIDEKLTVNGRATNITLRDELTPLSLELLKELRESQELLNVKYVWAGRGGVVLVKKDENSKPELVKNREDLIRIFNQFMKTARCSESEIVLRHSPSPRWNYTAEQS